MKKNNLNDAQFQEITNITNENISTLYKRITISLVILGVLSIIALCISIYALENLTNHLNLTISIIFGINALAFFLLAMFLNNKRILKENDYKNLVNQTKK